MKQLFRCPFPNHPVPLAGNVERSLPPSFSRQRLSLFLSPSTQTATRRLWETQQLTLFRSLARSLSLSRALSLSLHTHSLHRANTGEANGSMHSTAEVCKIDFDLPKAPESHDHGSIQVDFTMEPGVFICFVCVRARTCPCIPAQVLTCVVVRGWGRGW